MADINPMGAAIGLLGSKISGDSTTIPLQIRAIMAKRNAEKKDSTPAWTTQDALKAINEGYKGMTQAQRDSAASKFNHSEYLKHLDELGMQVVPKKSQ